MLKANKTVQEQMGNWNDCASFIVVGPNPKETPELALKLCSYFYSCCIEWNDWPLGTSKHAHLVLSNKNDCAVCMHVYMCTPVLCSKYGNVCRLEWKIDTCILHVSNLLPISYCVEMHM